MLYSGKFLLSSEIYKLILSYLDLGIYYLEFTSRSALLLSSTAPAIISHLVSISASLPLNMDDPAVNDKNIGETIDN